MTTPQPGVWPTLRATDARTMIRFLVEAFGFEEVVVYGEGEHVDHAELAWPPGGGVMLGSRRDDPHPLVGPASSFSAYLVTDEPDALHARALAAGAEEVRPLQDTEYGSREFAVRDPEGGTWSFGTYRGHPR